MKGTGVRLRALRAGLFTALCVALSSASHILLSRMPLPATTVAALSAGYFALSFALAGRERGYWPIAGLLIPLELAADTVFTTGQHACYGPAGGPVAGPLHSLGIDLVCRSGQVGAPLARMATVPHTPDQINSTVPWLLLAGHITIGLLAAFWLRRGEVALTRLLRALAAFAVRPLLWAAAALGIPLRPSGATVRPARDTLRSRKLPLLVHSVVRRGPPQALTA
ncbi:hypothetical protein [Streptomyces caatingaensis]|uniref:Membrane protein n=1 Tax=Streptomyces caatingaensis TaxID=1678637 RepID=A0A0K9XJ74_9ACTN|nr:hypothetical protein [Streptomyces caatingaensis]KNB52682.1 membrane protein [Streptomyces caatingaensis]